MNKIKRPLFWMAGSFIFGIIGGEVYLKEIRLLPLFLGALLIAALIARVVLSLRAAGIGMLLCILGFVWTLMQPVIADAKCFLPDKQVVVSGCIVKLSTGAFSDTATLNNVSIEYQNKRRTIRSKVNIIFPKESSLKLYDTVKVTGSVSDAAKKMNPSDMDYEMYLRSQGIAATLKSKHYEITSSANWQNFFSLAGIKQQIRRLYQEEDKGIMEALLIGNDDEIPPDVYNVYQKTGIVHVLSISGFHIALLISSLFFLLSYLGVPYTPKYLTICCMIWLYTFLTGGSTSTVRASIMASLIIFARCIWEEEDPFTDLALAAWLILLQNPFQLSQAGFQLSFAAVGCLFLSNIIIEKIEPSVPKNKLKLVRALVAWSCVTLGTYPILAYHFYQVPLLCTLLNLILVPVFSLIIILGWICLVVSIGHFYTGFIIAKGIIFLLNAVQFIAEKMLHIPLGTLCTGKPGLVSQIVYLSLIGIIFCRLSGYIKIKTGRLATITAISMYILYQGLQPRTLDVAYLYVGQGDGIVASTPQHKIIVIDGGNFGKGKVMERYIKYRGNQTVSAIILSHSDADHIGGIIELLDTDIKVQNLFISKTDDSSLLRQLLQKCIEKKIKVYQVSADDKMTIDNIQIQYLAPFSSGKAESANDNSIGCLLSYKQFAALFTGDLSKPQERQMCDKLSQVTILKVSHHGSKTATAEEDLLKIKPQYAIISCGIHNRFGHPHAATLETLEKYPIHVLRTDLEGAVIVSTNGKKVMLSPQIKGD